MERQHTNPEDLNGLLKYHFIISPSSRKEQTKDGEIAAAFHQRVSEKVGD